MVKCTFLPFIDRCLVVVEIKIIRVSYNCTKSSGGGVAT